MQTHSNFASYIKTMVKWDGEVERPIGPISLVDYFIAIYN